jgi:hypothetical protein
VACSNLPPEFGETEEEFLYVWRYANTQWRVSSMGPVGIDYQAVFKIAETFGVDVDETFIRRLKAIELAEIQDMHKE